MNDSIIFCPGGATSQTGIAAKARYPKSRIETCGKIPDVLHMLPTNAGPYAIPIWNSHEGEVKAARAVWDQIEQAELKITDAWAKAIDFDFLGRVASTTSYGLVGSVLVAETQCSMFLKARNLNLEKCELTTIAFEQFRNGARWDGVLVAPGQGEGYAEFEVLETRTANPINFTSFLRIVPIRAFTPSKFDTVTWFTGVKMRSFGESLRDADQSFFDSILETVEDLATAPKIIFVFNRDAQVGLLFEGAPLRAGDILDAEQLETDEISIYEDVGVATTHYTKELAEVFTREFPQILANDFILHIGVNTCLFACPPLNLYTHGYKIDTVKPVFCYYIDRLFQLWDEGVTCTDEQQTFFERHRENWVDRRSEFIEFEVIDGRS